MNWLSGYRRPNVRVSYPKQREQHFEILAFSFSVVLCTTASRNRYDVRYIVYIRRYIRREKYAHEQTPFFLVRVHILHVGYAMVPKRQLAQQQDLLGYIHILLLR